MTLPDRRRPWALSSQEQDDLPAMPYLCCERFSWHRCSGSETIPPLSIGCCIATPPWHTYAIFWDVTRSSNQES